MGASRNPDDTVQPLADLRGRVLGICAKIFAFGGIPLVFLVALQSWIAGQSIGPLIMEGVIVGVILWNVRAVHPLWRRSAAIVVGTLFISAVATVVFGPTMGTGMFYFGVVFICGLLLPARATVGVVVVEGVMVVSVWAAHQAGWISPQYMPDTPTYFRIIFSTLLTSVFAALVIVRFVAELERALLAEREALLAQQAAHEEQQRTAKAAEAAQRLEALGRLAGGVAHDVNNALAIIQGNLAVLQSNISDEARAEALADIEHGVERASDTTRQLVSIVQHERGARSTAVTQSLQNLVRSVRRALPPTIVLELNAETNRKIDASEGQFEQAILNLIVNAQDAMPDGGKVTVECRDDGPDVVISVTDNGSGIPPEHRERLFEPFFTTKGEDGTGVGLTMVWGFVTRANGTIAVEEPADGGTRFVLRFPANVDSSQELVVEVAPSALSVLLLEDQPLVQRSLVRMLETLGHCVVASGTTAEAIELLSAATFDMFITDGHVPDAPVREAVTAFQQAQPRAPVILCTGNPAGVLAFDDIGAAGITLLQKPFGVAQLREAIATATSSDRVD